MSNERTQGEQLTDETLIIIAAQDKELGVSEVWAKRPLALASDQMRTIEDEDPEVFDEERIDALLRTIGWTFKSSDRRPGDPRKDRRKASWHARRIFESGDEVLKGELESRIARSRAGYGNRRPIYSTIMLALLKLLTADIRQLWRMEGIETWGTRPKPQEVAVAYYLKIQATRHGDLTALARWWGCREADLLATLMGYVESFPLRLANSLAERSRPFYASAATGTSSAG